MTEKKKGQKPSTPQSYGEKEKPFDNFTKAMKKIVSVPKNKLKGK